MIEFSILTGDQLLLDYYLSRLTKSKDAPVLVSIDVLGKERQDEIEDELRDQTLPVARCRIRMLLAETDADGNVELTQKQLLNDSSQNYATLAPLLLKASRENTEIQPKSLKQIQKILARLR